MAETTVLVIDDSATIRRFVDTTLNPAGYRVVLAPNAEDGIRLAQEILPDVILLDHQLPGTTGSQVCQTLQSTPQVNKVPVVISSTLRKKAYAEYTDMPNVVDMLPKPYTAELLITTVSNALETGKLIVQSQTQGTAVPEMIEAVEDSDLAGTFTHFSPREVIDFLNNGRKSGILEIETNSGRVKLYLANGRIQAVSGTGIDTARLMVAIPDSLRELAPVLKLTVSGRMCAELDGLVELLDRQVLDPRLLKTLLRFQASQLIWMAFHAQVKGFAFRSKLSAPPLFRKLPLDISLSGLLVEAALTCDADQLTEGSEEQFFVRADVRGQNADRAGLSAKHLKALSAISEAVSPKRLAGQLGWELDEVIRVLEAFRLADLVDVRSRSTQIAVIAVETSADATRVLQQAFESLADRYNGKVIRDRVALQILLKRTDPGVMFIGADTAEEVQFGKKLRQHFAQRKLSVRLIGLRSAQAAPDPEAGKIFESVLTRPLSLEDVVNVLDRTESAADHHSARHQELVAAK